EGPADRRLDPARLRLAQHPVPSDGKLRARLRQIEEPPRQLPPERLPGIDLQPIAVLLLPHHARGRAVAGALLQLQGEEIVPAQPRQIVGHHRPPCRTVTVTCRGRGPSSSTSISPCQRPSTRAPF